MVKFKKGFWSKSLKNFCQNLLIKILTDFAQNLTVFWPKCLKNYRILIKIANEYVQNLKGFWSKSKRI